MEKETERIDTEAAPPPLGSYSHAVRAGHLLFVSGQGARDPETGREKGVVLDEGGCVAEYDIRVQTRAALENVKAVVESAGGKLMDIVEMTVFLINMSDFSAYNEVYTEFFSVHKPARTTVGAASLPGNNAIEIKAIAFLSDGV